MRVLVSVGLFTALLAACSSAHTSEEPIYPGLDAGPSDLPPRTSVLLDGSTSMDAGRSPAPASRGTLLFAEVEDADGGDTSKDGSVPHVELDGPTSVLVVLDKSGSMSAVWANGDTRWVAANKALIAALSPARAQLTIGAVLFPQPDGCTVSEINDTAQYPFVPGTQFIDTWKRTIERNGVGGSTPLERSLAVAANAIDGASALLTQKFIVLLVTDGEPTCKDNLEAVEAYPAALRARGIVTHVMGLPGSEAAAALLDRIAKAGGSERHQSIGSPDQLVSAVAALL
jgi:hypothetical protein